MRGHAIHGQAHDFEECIKCIAIPERFRDLIGPWSVVHMGWAMGLFNLSRIAR